MSYRPSREADRDLEDLAEYTLSNWGVAAYERYRDGLEGTFEAMGAGDVVERKFSDAFPELPVTRYRHHHIFHFTDGLDKPGIIGVIHERRDIVRLLSERAT